MRVGLIRQDIARLYLDDVENTSQRAFSSSPPGQSRYFEPSSFNAALSVLNEWAFLSVLGSAAVFPLTLTGANNTLTVKTTAAAGTTMVIPTGAYTAAQLATAINAALAANGLFAVAVVVGGQIQMDSIAPGNRPPSFASWYNSTTQPPLGLTPNPPAPFVNPINSGPTAILQVTGTLAVALGIAGTLFTGLPVNSLLSVGTGSPSGVYVNTGVAGQSGVVASIVAGPGGTYTVTGLTGMTANSVLHFLVITNSGSSNNGTYQIVKFNSATSVNIVAPPGQSLTVPDANNGSVHWSEDTVSFNISYTQIGTLSTFTTMEGYSATTPTGAFLSLAQGIQNLIAPGLVETGPALMSFAVGKLNKLLSPSFQPGSGVSSQYPFGEGAPQRLGSVTGPAVFITANDGVTPFTL
jgi:hypothetical protein